MKDHEAIRQTALDYIEGWYFADASRMDRALSPHLSKRQFNSNGEIRDVSKTTLIEITGKGRGQLDNPDKGRKDITILDQTDTMASVKIVSEEFIDYLHLVKTQGNWTIVNVLWDFSS